MSTQGRPLSSGKGFLIMAIAIEEVLAHLDQLREGLVEMRGYL